MWLTFLLLGMVIGTGVSKFMMTKERKSRSHYLNKALDNVRKVAEENGMTYSAYVKGTIFGLEQAFKLTGTPRKVSKRHSDKIEARNEANSHLPKVKVIIRTDEGLFDEITTIPDSLSVDDFVSQVLEKARIDGSTILSMHKENKVSKSYDIRLY